MKLIIAYWRKEFLLHWRKPQKILSLWLFSILLLTLFHFAIGEKNKIEFSVGIYWIQFLLTGSLALKTIFTSDESSKMSDIIRLSQYPDIFIYIAKFSFLLLFWLITQLLQLLLIAILYDARFFEQFGSIFLAAALAGIGFLSIGITISKILHGQTFVEFMLPLLVFPMLLPIFLGGIKIFEGLLDGIANITPWISLLVLFDVIYLLAGLSLNLLDE